MILDLRRLQQRLESNPPGRLYLLMGEETFLIQEAMHLLKHKSVDAAAIDFNCDVFDASETEAAHVKDAAEMLPMMSARRFVAFRGVDELK
ncbi:MAG: hypothetical protein HC883_03425, partial [Bdellovibrionaceae bacterium]|nr:hypothetical protein [Pseudobdellovibrionaceae bacterium]